jgi:HNH endonuclease
MLTQERLKQVLSYDPDTGVFRWEQPSKRTPYLKGREAGSMNSKGYRTVRIDNREYKAHRLSWFYMTGEWPKMIDHKNRKRDDNRWDNLRLGSASLNAFNKTPHKLSNTGIRGVFFRSPRRYEAYIGGGGGKGRGYFPTLEEAVAARKTWEERLSLSGIV